MDSDSNTPEDQYNPSLYGPCMYRIVDYQSNPLEAPITHVPRATLFANPDVFVHQVFSDLVGQMDGWIWELNDIKKTIESRKSFPSTTPTDFGFVKRDDDDYDANRDYGLDAGIASDQPAGSVHEISYDYDYADANYDDLDAERDNSGHEPVVSEHDHDLGLDRPVHFTETGLDLADLGTAFLDGRNYDVNDQDDDDDDDDDSLKKQYSAIEKGRARLRQIQQHIKRVRCSLLEVGGFHSFLPEESPHRLLAAT
ncbi:hypothetical protein BDV10DRAFT_19782 [Aspergillus recurvatus]